MRRFLLSLFVVLFALSAPYARADASAFNGKSGDALRKAIAASCRPSTLHRGPQSDLVIDIDTYTDNAGTARMVDRFNVADPAIPVQDYYAQVVAHYTWWTSVGPDYGDTLKLDLHNVIPSPTAAAHVTTHTPWRVDPKADGSWNSEYIEIDSWGNAVECWTPPLKYRGDIARILLYMTTVYPCEYWDACSWMIMSDNLGGGLNEHGRELLLEWHRSDPVDVVERRRNNRIAEIQGNRNPFVDYPELVEHLWGNKTDEPVIFEDERMPLKSQYHIDESRIDLWAPYIPADAEWTVDGAPAPSTRLTPSQLGPGRHELRFESPSRKGKLMIEIVL